MSHANQSAPEDLSTGELVSRVSDRVSQLVQKELQLARAEITDKSKRARGAAGWFGGGGLVGLYGVGCLIAASVFGLANVLADWLAALIVGAVLVLVAVCCALLGRRRLAEATPPIPAQAMEGVRADVEAAKEGLRR
jgi:hypothetical protein